MQNNKTNNLLQEHLAVHNVFHRVYFINYEHFDLLILTDMYNLNDFCKFSKVE